MIIRKRVYGRIGLVGNPSDGYFGKTIAVAIRNFSAKVTLWESPTLELLPHPANDPTRFGGLKELTERARSEGYYGGLRLLFATCMKFHTFCQSRGIALDDRNFTIAYETTIPRQVGLGGSSAIITATVRALMEFFDVREEIDIPKPELPNLILSVETEELGIAAGLQDRVIQVYGGAVFMDFSKTLMDERGYGEYSYLDAGLLPPLFLAYDLEGSESGKIHSDVRYRYHAGDAEVHAAMREWADYAVRARDALWTGDTAKLETLFNRNFDLRRRIFGDKALGDRNLEMIDIARRMGCPSNFSGSGGAVFGVYRDAEQLERLHTAYASRGYAFTPIVVDRPDAEAQP